MAAAVVTAVVVFLATLFRQVGVPKIATMWAEDGSIFLQCAYDDGLACLVRPYQGYYHLVPRIIAALTDAMPPIESPAIVTVLSAFVAAGAAVIACRSITDATSSALAGLLGGVGLALVWQAGREVLGNSANAHWILLASTTIAIVSTWLGARIGPAMMLLAAVTGLTSALSPVIAALSFGGVALRRPRALALAIVSTCAAGVQIAVEATNIRQSAGHAVTLGQIIAFFRSEVIGRGFFGPSAIPAGYVVPILIIVGVISVAMTHRDRKVPLGVVVVVMTLVATGLALCAMSIILNDALNPRYAYLPTSLMVAALAIAGGSLASGLARGSPRPERAARFLMPGVVAIVGVGFALSFRLDARASTGPDVPLEIRSAIAPCVPGASATVTISPTSGGRVWTLVIPCTRLAPP